MRPETVQRDALVAADLASHLKRTEPLRILGNTGVALAVVYLMRDSAPPAWLAIWFAAMLTHSAFNAWAAWRVWHRPTRTENAPRRLRAVVRAEAMNGLLWMAAELIILPGSDYTHRALLMVLLSGLGAGVMQSLCAYLPALYAFFGPAVLGFLVAGSLTQGSYFVVALALLLVWVAVNLSFARLMHRTLVDSLHNRHIANALAVDLEVQRDRAVELGRSRSRFLAAASHDLRQPVHALSLFVGALGQNPSQEQSRHILKHVGGAIDAMGSMFNAMLDISKLDADLLQPNWQVLDLRALLLRVAADQPLLAGAKGLRFGCELPAASHPRVRCDPVLLERILRNLLSNALRYTTEGSVLLRLRVRGGRAEIVVADSGAGIPRERREQVFEEFVQLPHPEREREREQGLGLGLAIVKRLVGLLGLRLVLRSRPGRGTVFSLRLPLADEPASTDSGLATSHGTQGKLGKGDIVIVVDDSADIRLAMSALLSAWGCQVFTAASVRDLMPQMMNLSAPPRLLLCDYRLADGVSGIAAIDQLRDAFNQDIPAVLVTGDTAPEPLREAVASGLPLLHKPVTQQQLREAMERAIAMDEAVCLSRAAP
ncbi:MAG: hybrid sensor histidine kinase/response regulator [Burkholderiaceae bacterium]|nr:hybrid sensor histidine kinase/response regulator [Burkholderiaceae bacterium]